MRKREDYIKWVCVCAEIAQVTWSKLYIKGTFRLLKTLSCDCDSLFLKCNEECHEDTFYSIKQPEFSGICCYSATTSNVNIIDKFGG